MKYLIVDGYPKSARDELQAAGASMGWQLFQNMLLQREPDAEVTIIYPSDEETVMTTEEIEGFDGLLWTGCSLCLHSVGDDRVDRQVEIAKRAFQAGVPQFGSCWAIQIAAVAAGGKVEGNPKGREMGLARKIALTDAGRVHPMYTNKPQVFDAFICHLDEVTELPEDATLLATNSFTHIQAAEIRHAKGVFWGVQYHPEYTVGEMAKLAHARKPALIKEGFFQNDTDASAWVSRLEGLQADPTRKDLSWGLSIDDDVLSDDVRQCELINWLAFVKSR